MTLGKHHLALGALLLAAGIGWLIANPPGRFGWCQFGCTTYNSIPRLISDFQVRPDGGRRVVSKTHTLTMEHIRWLLDSKPDILVIALGWDGVTKPDDAIRRVPGCEVHFLKNGEAIRMFNRLKREGRRVAIHYHSTC